MTKLSPTFIAAAAYVGGFNSSEVPTATAIALAESSGDPKAKNASGAVGLWQILPSANQDIIDKYKSIGGVTSPLANAKMAYTVYKRQGWSAWETYTNGAYKQYMSTATSANATAKKNPVMIAEGDPSKWEINGQVAPSVATQVASSSPLTSIDNALGVLTSPATWLRFALIAGGALVVIVGLVLMIESDKNVQGITKLASLA